MYRKAPEMVKFAAIFGSNRYLVPFNGGIATPVCALARNDSVIFDKHQFIFLIPEGGGMGAKKIHN